MRENLNVSAKMEYNDLSFMIALRKADFLSIVNYY